MYSAIAGKAYATSAQTVVLPNNKHIAARCTQLATWAARLWVQPALPRQPVPTVWFYPPTSTAYQLIQLTCRATHPKPHNVMQGMSLRLTRRLWTCARPPLKSKLHPVNRHGSPPAWKQLHRDKKQHATTACHRKHVGRRADATCCMQLSQIACQ